MRRLRLAVSALALLVLIGGGLVGQEKKADDKKVEDKKVEEKKPEPRLKGLLPFGWKQLALSDEQKQRIYKVQIEYKEKLDALDTQIAALKKERSKAYEKVLTPAQKARLKEIREQMQ